MAKKMTISVADEVYSKILDLMDKHGKKNKSEFTEELIRVGLYDWENKEVEA